VAAAPARAAERGRRGIWRKGLSRRRDQPDHRARGVATGSFYVYFDSKEAIFRRWCAIFRARCAISWRRACGRARPAGRRERGQAAYLDFVRQHKEIYRIIDEAEFVDPASYRAHYTNSARASPPGWKRRPARRNRPGDAEVRAWALMGINVFLGLRFGVWGEGADQWCARPPGWWRMAGRKTGRRKHRKCRRHEEDGHDRLC
jgi:AcrR family transcriptional regulator